MYAAARFAFRVPGLAAETVFALGATVIMLPVTIPMGRAAIRALQRSHAREQEQQGMLHTVSIGLSTLGTVLPIQALRSVYWRWGEAIDDLRRSSVKGFS